MDYLSFILAVIFCTLKGATAQTENADTLESCNVVCNCNSGQSTEATAQNHQLTNQGPPGKLGPKGDVGSVGAKGEKGDMGLKGQRGMKGTEISLPDVLDALSASSCQDLHTRFHLSRSGYYMVKSPASASPVYRYCDFRRYADVTTCDQLFEKYNLSTVGYFIFGQNVTHNGTFRICPTPPIGIHTCQAFRDRYPILTSAYSGRYEFHSTSVGTTYSVYCDFSQSPAVTEIHHDIMDETRIASSCEAVGCFTARPNYDVNSVEIRKIIDNSVSCKQFIKLRCKGVIVRRNDITWWVSTDGSKMTYWGGATRTDYCACGETNSCIDTRYKCNCDQNSESITTSDEGYLTDKTKLPLREIRVGDMGGTNEVAWYTIGKLECSGQV